MAKIVLTADATKAKQAVDDLDKRLRKLDKQSKKPIRPTVAPRVQGGTGGGALSISPSRIAKSGGSFISQVGGALGVRAAGAAGGMLGAVGNIAVGASIGGAAGALAAAAIQLASSIGETKDWIDGAKKAVSLALDPQTAMRERTKWKDSLADKARTNGATMAEQFATEEARKNTLGEVSGTMFQKMGQSVQSAFAGDNKAINALLGLGVNGDMLKGMSALEQQDVIFKAISEKMASNDAISDPYEKSMSEAEIFKILRDVVGARNMMEARTFSDSYGEYSRQKAFLIKRYQEANSPASDARMLEAARLAELKESEAVIEQNREIAPHLSGYAVEKGVKTLDSALTANKGGIIRGSITSGNNEYNRQIQESPVFQNTLKAIERNTAKNAQLTDRLLNKTRSKDNSEATYS